MRKRTEKQPMFALSNGCYTEFVEHVIKMADDLHIKWEYGTKDGSIRFYTNNILKQIPFGIRYGFIQNKYNDIAPKLVRSKEFTLSDEFLSDAFGQ